jgi:K+-transporting ATPase ATPase A chain
MTVNGWIQIAIYFAVLTALVVPLGRFMARVFQGERTFLTPVLGPVERGLYRIAGVDETREQHWITYTVAMLLFNAACFLCVYALMRLQGLLPLNPAGMSAVAPDLTFNTAVSFATNTNWQNYGGESTLSYLTQMVGLTTQNFVSAATGIALAVALIRGFARASAKTVGNFWVDLTRCTLYVLLPLSIIAALVLVWQGVPQNLGAYVDATTLEGAKQVISQGPAASQIAISSAQWRPSGNQRSPVSQRPSANLIGDLHPFISAARTLGAGQDERARLGRSRRVDLFFAVSFVCSTGRATRLGAGLDPQYGGKEVRFGIANSSLWAVATSDASNGSVNSMHDSYTPLGGMIPLLNIQLGEIIFGGVGSGLYGMLLMVIIAVFVAGLMVGRTPEYLGKKIEAKEVKMSMLAILMLPLGMLCFTAAAVVLPFGVSSMANAGPHGFSEALYLYTSQTGNNGSAFAGITGNTLWYNTTGGLDMLIGRYFIIIPMMAVAGSLVAKKIVPASSGTFPTHGGLFIGLVVGVILIVGGLSFFPALALGPIVEHYAMMAGQLF